ncbi:MAG TPA: hypothetical protein VEV37_12520 [Bryobacteraceae bacterium]|nr:hypothetical protein [Bryobacteraceae bacterium]
MLSSKPAWLEPIFPWKQKSIKVNGRSMAYIDEGDRAGHPVLLRSGNPTWGSLYRDFIRPLDRSDFIQEDAGEEVAAHIIGWMTA